jgi:hypothetical protein
LSPLQTSPSRPIVHPLPVFWDFPKVSRVPFLHGSVRLFSLSEVPVPAGFFAVVAGAFHRWIHTMWWLIESMSCGFGMRGIGKTDATKAGCPRKLQPQPTGGSGPHCAFFPWGKASKISNPGVCSLGCVHADAQGVAVSDKCLGSLLKPKGQETLL